MVRQESAKLLYVGSIPTRASNRYEASAGMGGVEAKALSHVEEVVALFTNKSVLEAPFPFQKIRSAFFR